MASAYVHQVTTPSLRALVGSPHPPTGREVATNGWCEGDRVAGKSIPSGPDRRPGCTRQPSPATKTRMWSVRAGPQKRSSPAIGNVRAQPGALAPHVQSSRAAMRHRGPVPPSSRCEAEQNPGRTGEAQPRHFGLPALEARLAGAASLGEGLQQTGASRGGGFARAVLAAPPCRLTATAPYCAQTGNKPCPSTPRSRAGSRPRAGRRAPHQLDVLEATEAGASALLIAPTGAGKTLAGFLPTLNDLIAAPVRGPAHALHLAAQGAGRRRGAQPHDARSPRWACRSRSRPAPATPRPRARQRQRYDPPHILLTTPEQLALLLSHGDAGQAVRRPAGASSSTSCTRWSPTSAANCCRSASPGSRTLAPAAAHHRAQRHRRAARPAARLDRRAAARRRGAAADRRRAAPSRTSPSSTASDRVPWAGHSAPMPCPSSTRSSRQHRTTLLFVNTRSQAELLFQNLWAVNEDGLAIALHHGSLVGRAAAQGRERHGRRASSRRWSAPRRSTSASTGAMSTSWCRSARPRARAACCSASAAPTTGSTSHPRRCSSPPTASRCSNARRRSKRSSAAQQDSEDPVAGGLDVLAQHVLGIGLRRAHRSARALRRDPPRLALSRPRLGAVRARARFRRHRRLCAARL